MSAVFTLFFVMGFMLVADAANRHNRCETGPVAGSAGTRRVGESRARRPFAASLAVPISMSLLLALCLAARHVTLRSTSSDVVGLGQAALISNDAKRQLEAELTDAAVVADLNTLKAYQKALVDKLASTTLALNSRPYDATLLRRRELLEVVLTNGGGTGVNDRLSDFDAATRTVASRSAFTEADATTVRRAMANLRSSAASWKTGAFGNLATFLGLHWDNGRGLTTHNPYVWGSSGWESDPVHKTCEQRINKRDPASC